MELYLILKKIQGGENSNTLVISLPAQYVVFIGDLVLNKRHLYLAETTDYGQFITILQKLQISYPYRNLLSGHGRPADNSIIQSNIEYIDFVRNVANTFKTQSQYVAALTNRYPANPPYEYMPGIIQCPFTAPNCSLGLL